MNRSEINALSDWVYSGTLMAPIDFVACEIYTFSCKQAEKFRILCPISNMMPDLKLALDTRSSESFLI